MTSPEAALGLRLYCCPFQGQVLGRFRYSTTFPVVHQHGHVGQVLHPADACDAQLQSQQKLLDDLLEMEPDSKWASLTQSRVALQMLAGAGLLLVLLLLMLLLLMLLLVLVLLMVLPLVVLPPLLPSPSSPRRPRRPPHCPHCPSRGQRAAVGMAYGTQCNHPARTGPADRRGCTGVHQTGQHGHALDGADDGAGLGRGHGRGETAVGWGETAGTDGNLDLPSPRARHWPYSCNPYGGSLL